MLIQSIFIIASLIVLIGAFTDADWLLKGRQIKLLRGASRKGKRIAYSIIAIFVIAFVLFA